MWCARLGSARTSGLWCGARMALCALVLEGNCFLLGGWKEFLKAMLATGATLKCLGGGCWPLGGKLWVTQQFSNPLSPSLLDCNGPGEELCQVAQIGITSSGGQCPPQFLLVSSDVQAAPWMVHLHAVLDLGCQKGFSAPGGLWSFLEVSTRHPVDER